MVGFYFLEASKSYEPPSDLLAFIDAGEPPIYIGFGSVVVDDPSAMTSELPFLPFHLLSHLRTHARSDF